MALVASTAALAQVTVYGTVDGGIANTSVRGGAGTGTYFSGDGGYVAGNNIGFKGSEDLGGGLSVNFTLQTGFGLGQGRSANGTATSQEADLTSGAVSGVNQAVFSQVSSVGVAGEFGAVNLGQQLSPFIATAAGGSLGNGHFWVNRLTMAPAAALPGNLAGNATNFPTAGFFIPNAISYSLPAGLPVTGTLLTSTKAGTGGLGGGTGALGGLPEDRYTAFNLGTSVGSINLGLAHEARSNSYKNTIFTAGTNIGEIQLVGSYLTVKRDVSVAAAGEGSIGSMSLGAGYNVTPEFNASIQWARNGDTPGASPSLTAVTGKYTLSKRTTLYASFLRASDGAQSNYDLRGGALTPAVDGSGAGTSNSTSVVGIAHSF